MIALWCSMYQGNTACRTHGSQANGLFSKVCDQPRMVQMASHMYRLRMGQEPSEAQVSKCSEWILSKKIYTAKVPSPKTRVCQRRRASSAHLPLSLPSHQPYKNIVK